MSEDPLETVDLDKKMNGKMAAIVGRCVRKDTITLDDFVGDLMDLSADELKLLPGSPAKVMCAQFLYYVKLNKHLSRAEERKAAPDQVIYDSVKAAQFKVQEAEQRKKKLDRKKEAHSAIAGARAGTASRGRAVTAA